MAAVCDTDTRGESGEARAGARLALPVQGSSVVGSPHAARPVLTFEPTPTGEQSLVTGVAPITVRDRLAFMMAAPLLPKRPQRAADHGLFDLAARNQLDFFQPKDL